MKIKLLLIISLLLLTQTNIYCQDSSKRIINQKFAGLLVEYAQPYYFLPEGTRYYAALIGGMFSLPLYQTKNLFNISVEFYPHYGYVWVKGDKNYYEIGLNTRFGFNFSLSANDMFSLKLGIEPHYITVETEKQARGFIFSDYYLVSYKRAINNVAKPLIFDFEFGYRHMSNAHIKLPNRSISNFIFGIAILKTL